jgi:hypothetical protein
MNKIPMGPTIAAAYRFIFTGLERIIGVIWLPIILMTIGDYFVNGQYLAGMANALEANDATQVAPMLAAIVGYGLIKLLLVAIIGVGLTREILAPLKRPMFLRASVGGAELRFAVALLALCALLYFVFMICFVLAMVFGGSVTGMPGMAEGQKAIGLVVLLLLVLSPVLIYTFLRLAFLVAPSVTIEGRFGIERSWILTKGNVGRIFVIALAVVVPLALVNAILQAAVMGPAGGGGLNLFAAKAEQTRQTAESLRQMSAHLPLLMGIQFVLAPFVYGLMFAAPAYIYKALTAPATKE